MKKLKGIAIEMEKKNIEQALASKDQLLDLYWVIDKEMAMCL